MSANFLSSETVIEAASSASQPFVTCQFPECTPVIPWSGYVCYDNDNRQSCRVQNWPTPDQTSGVCMELEFGKTECVAGVITYFCQTIRVHECGFGPGPQASPSPTPSPQPCTYCTDPNAIRPADCSNPSNPKCTGDFEYQEFGCCYRQTCERAGIVPPPPPPGPAGYFRPSNELQPFPLCTYKECIPPEAVSNSSTCQFLGYYWNSRIPDGSSPAIGNCGGGPDWGNYFSTGCYSGLGLFGGSFCDGFSFAHNWHGFISVMRDRSQPLSKSACFRFNASKAACRPPTDHRAHFTRAA